MRLAIHNPFPDDAPWAERELALRMLAAAERLGWQAAILSDPEALERFAPDAALCLHPEAVAKMHRHVSLACLWNPPEFFQGLPMAPWRALSHDAFLVASQERLDFLKRQGRDQPIWRRFWPSSPDSDNPPRLHAGSRLFYVGSNWDGQRYPGLLQALAERDLLALYGSAERWNHLSRAYRGALPFDGRSVIAQAGEDGLGLCLHLPAHPNMRIFELCAAGALAICGRHPFLEDAFGDTVLYVDQDAPWPILAEAITEKVAWARANPAQGRAMAAEAQSIFRHHYALETLMRPWPDWLADRQPAARPGRVRRSISLIVADAGLDQPAAVASLALQTHPPLETQHLAPTRGRAEPGILTFIAAIERAKGDVLAFLPSGAEPWPHFCADLCSGPPETAAAVGALIRHEGGDAKQGEDLPASANRAIQPYRLAGFAPAQPPFPFATALPVPWAQHWLAQEAPHHAAEWQAQLSAPTLWARMVEAATAQHPLWHAGTAAIRLERMPPLLDRTAPEEEEPPAPPFFGLRPPGSWHQGWPKPRLATAGPSDDSPTLACLPTIEDGEAVMRLPTDRPLFIYGASRGGRLLQLEILKWPHLRLAGFLDRQASSGFDGLHCRSLEAALAAGAFDQGAGIILASQYVREIMEHLQAHLRARPPPSPAIVIFNAYPFIHAHVLMERRWRDDA
jgi:hypothetical protein